ncbi:MAG TPA: threonine aldolase family protein [Gemmatimonadaceae bacterium]
MIDLRSDTVTKPTPGMRQAMANAEVGDDERDGDPTTQRLEARVAELLGKEAALFFPSGCMANQAGIWLFAERGTEVMVDVDAHIVEGEIAGMASLSGAQAFPVHGTNGVMTAADLERDLRPPSRYSPMPSLVCVENTHNTAGGRVTPLSELKAIQKVAAKRKLPVHMDGARLWNASVASGTSLADFASCADTVMVAFSKGLGAPVGAALAGTKAAMERAWTARKMFGGAMRQSGIVAAAALYGLDHHYDRLAEDHANAKALAKSVDGVGGVSVVPPDTNIVMIDLAPGDTSARVAADAAKQGVRVAQWTPTRVRMVTHLDVSAADCKRAGDVMRTVLSRQ